MPIVLCVGMKGPFWRLENGRLAEEASTLRILQVHGAEEAQAALIKDQSQHPEAPEIIAVVTESMVAPGAAFCAKYGRDYCLYGLPLLEEIRNRFSSLRLYLYTVDQEDDLESPEFEDLLAQGVQYRYAMEVDPSDLVDEIHRSLPA